MKKRESAQRLRDLETGQRAFDALRPAEQRVVVDALHAEQVELIAGQAHWEWDYLLSRLADEGAEAALTVKKWQTRLAGAPQHVHHELEWADSLFEAAAVAWVNHEVLRGLNGVGLDKTLRWVTDRLISAARPGTSSSQSHNLMGHFEAKALGRALETLRW